MKTLIVAVSAMVLLTGCPEEKKDGAAPASTAKASAATTAAAATAKPADSGKPADEGGW